MLAQEKMRDELKSHAQSSNLPNPSLLRKGTA